MKKHNKIFAVALCVLVAAAFAFLRFYVRKIPVNIEWSAALLNSKTMQAQWVTLKITGTYHDGLTKDDVFRGVVEIPETGFKTSENSMIYFGLGDQFLRMEDENDIFSYGYVHTSGAQFYPVRIDFSINPFTGEFSTDWVLIAPFSSLPLHPASADYSINTYGALSGLDWGCTDEDWLASAKENAIEYAVVEDGLNTVVSAKGSFVGVPADITLCFINSDTGKTLRSMTVAPDTEEDATELRNQLDYIFGARCEESVTESGTLYPLDEEHKFWHSLNSLDELLDDDGAAALTELGYSRPRLRYLYPVMVYMQKDAGRKTVFEIDGWLENLLQSMDLVKQD